MLLENRIERRTAGLLLYALQIASSNFKRIDQEKPQPAEMVTDPENMDSENMDQEITPESASQTAIEPANQNQEASEASAKQETNGNKKMDAEDPPLGTITIQACHHPGPQTRNRESQGQHGKRQYVI
jgi:hypothetical protein